MTATIGQESGAMLVNRLSRLLGERRLSISEAARRSGVSYKTVFDLYHDRTTRVDLGTIDKLCRALGCTPNDLFEYVKDPEPAAGES
ncbi:MAG: helix-turn-helix domain-containing protein [Chloroflexota bacterium]